MRIVAYILILVGLIFLADAAYDEHQGIASARSAQLYTIAHTKDPGQFRSLMAYQWARGLITLLGGFLTLGICRRVDRTDPFSPDFTASDTFDDPDRTPTGKQIKSHDSIR